MLATELVQSPCAADAVNRRPQPQRYHQLRRCWRMSRHPFARVDCLVQWRKVERAGKRPHGTHRVIVRDHVVQCRPLHINLIALRNPQPRCTAPRSHWRTLLRQAKKQSIAALHRQCSAGESVSVSESSQSAAAKGFRCERPKDSHSLRCSAQSAEHRRATARRDRRRMPGAVHP
jgi:hypothetical protein